MLSTSVRWMPLLVSAVLTQAVAIADNQDMRLQDRETYVGTAEGCYSSAGGIVTSPEDDTYQASGNCGPICAAKNKPVMALQGLYCYCAEQLPSLQDRLPTSACDESCPGYGDEACGGTSAYTIWLTWTGADPARALPALSDGSNVANHQGSSSNHKSKTQHKKPSSHHTSTTKTKPSPAHSTVYSTKTVSTTPGSGAQKTSGTSEPANTSSPSSSSSSSGTGTTVGIAVGVVAGVLVFAAFIAAILYCIRRRRRLKNAENGHRRADSLNAFVASGGHNSAASQPPTGKLAGRLPIPSMSDARLDPRLMRESRRDSTASYLADNQDYSRRILKVTNPDG